MTSTQIAPQTYDSDRAGERVWRTELSPVSFLRRAVEVHADAPALVHGARRLSYRELNERVTRLTSALRGLGSSIEQLMELVRSHGDDQKTAQAEQELPHEIDTDRDQNLLDKFGIDP